MKVTLVLVSFLSFVGVLFGGSLKYEDSPMGMPPELVALLEPYEKQAKETFHRFVDAFRQREGMAFFVVTRIYEGEIYEQVFVKVEEERDGTYLGTIASRPMGEVKFNEGDSVEVGVENIHDWLVVLHDGSEVGNLQGKAIDLLQVGVAVFVVRWRPVEGEFREFEVVSVRNPRTQQEIREIVPKEVVRSIEAYVASERSGQPSEHDEDRFGYILVSFPGWEIVEDAR